MSDTTKRKKTNMIHIGIGILTVLLVVFIVILMQLVSNIQGTARVVNYAGLIRGETQRIIKLENSGQREDELIKEVQSFIEGLRHGNDQLKLVRLKDDDFQDKMKELDEYFISLHKEIYRVRTVGYEHTDIISKSERFFKICDEATGLAEVYAQRKATSLATLEKFITADIVVLMLLIGYEFIKAVRFAAMNRILRHKAYLDNATGLPNKNKCEEILGELNPPEDIIVCSFDLNNLRRINDSMGHDAGDAYIYRFAVCLRSSIPSEHFVGRLGGDEYIAVLQGLDKQAVRKLFEDLRKDIAAESKEHREIPLSYAAGFAMASDYPGKTMRELFNDADKNMYINKNHVKREEALEEKRLNYQLLKLLNQHGKNFLDCLYCDAKLDTYRVIRSSENFFLALDGAYSSAVEQIVQEKIGKDEQKNIWERLQITRLQEKMKEKQDVQEYQYDMQEEGFYKRMTLIPVDWDEDKKLHHFLLAFEIIRKGADNQTGAREQLQVYYEQLKQSIIENDSYVDALLELSDVIYTVNLKTDTLERNIILKGKEQKNKELFLDYPLPCNYQDYCAEYEKKVTKETKAEYNMTNDTKKLLERYNNGDTNISVEYCFHEDDGSIRWVQKTILMTQIVVYDEETMSEIPTVYAITLLQDTSQRHKQEELEHARLQAAFDEMRTASQAKTDFLSRMSHDIRTPLNGIIGLLNINEKHFDDQKLVLENHKKMETAAKHLLSLINDVLQMSKIEEGQITLAHQEITVKKLMREVETMIRERVLEAGIRWNYEEDNIDDRYPYVYASPLHLRQILLNIYGNCIKYNHPGGTISTKMEQMDVHDKICTYRWTIKDTGIGISKDYIDHIFEPFSQEKTDARSVYQGTGLGMSIVKGLVEQMHGEIKVTSEKGMGSTFVITIPFEIAQKKEQPVAEKIVEQADIRGLNLLVAEDNQLNAEIIQTLLTDDGANVTVVEDGQQAVDQFKNASQGTFDAILMDIMMPVMDGLTATKEIRSIKRDDAAQIPIIAMTANAFEEDAKKCFAAGMNAHLAKPFQIDKIEKTLVQCIHKSI